MPLKPRKYQQSGRYAPGQPQGRYAAGRHGKSARRSGNLPSLKSVRRPLTSDVLRRIDSDSLFQVMTGDQQWIDPYTGQAVLAAQGRVEAARSHLLDSGAWRDREPLSRAQLEIVRWRIDLMRLLPVEPRLRIFSRDGRWLNPFTGELVSTIVREDGKIVSQTITTMAQALCNCPQAASGQLLDNQALTNIIQSMGLSGRADGSAGGALSLDMEKARNVQQNMLVDLPAIDGFELAVHFSPQAGVSGDFYEVINLRNERVLMVVGDVSGHGMQAALVVATALKTLRFLARSASNLIGLLTMFNDEIRPDLLPGQFITLFAAELDPSSGNLTCIRAGHHAAVLVNVDSEVMLRKVGRQGMAIGLAPGQLFAGSMHAEIVRLLPGDVLVQYTDGLTEAANDKNVEFGDARLYGSIFNHLDGSLQELVDKIAADVVRHVHGKMDDDLTIFAVAMMPEPEDVGGSGEWEGLEQRPDEPAPPDQG